MFASARKVAVKNNLLMDAMASVNFGGRLWSKTFVKKPCVELYFVKNYCILLIYNHVSLVIRGFNFLSKISFVLLTFIPLPD